MSSAPIVTTSERGKDKLASEGYLYVYDRLSKDNTLEFWRCQKRGSCKIRLHRSVATGEVMKITGSHSDPSDAAGVEVELRKQKMKRRACETQETPARLINFAHAGASSAVQGEFPRNHVLSKCINRARDTNHSAPAVPVCRSAIAVP